MSEQTGEARFQASFTNVLDHFEIEYEEEKRIPAPETPGSGAQIDVYIPKTDTAVELKTETGNLHTGVGQALNYTRSCKEAILILDGEDTDAYRPDIHKTCRIAPAVHFAMVIPADNPEQVTYSFDVSTDSRPDLFFEMMFNEEWPDDMIVVRDLIPGYQDYAAKVSRWNRPGDEHSLNEFGNE